MRNEPPSGNRLRFDAYDVDLRTGELRKDGRKVRLAGRPFQILALLLEQPGELLTREELRVRLWPAGTFVDFEHGMNAAIRTLRRALCDSHKKPRFIETLPRRGYRFIAVVDTIDPGAGKTPALPLRNERRTLAEPRSEWVGQVATIRDDAGHTCVLLPISEEILGEMRNCEAAKDDVGFSLLVAAQKLVLVNCGTKVRIIDASNPAMGCTIRILEGEFYGEKAFASWAYLSGLT